MEQIQANSHKAKAEREIKNSSIREKERPKSVIKGKVASTKTSRMRELWDECFNADRLADIWDNIIYDMVLPGIGDGLQDIIGMIFSGERRSLGSYYRRYNDKTSYSSRYGYGERSSRSRDRKRDRDELSSRDVNYREIILTERTDAENVVDELRDMINEYGSASISNLLNLVNLPSNYVQDDWGWRNPNDIGVRRIPGKGYLIDVREARNLRV